MAKAPDIDSEGYLVDPAEWTEEIAETFAEKEGVTLTDEHWAVIHFMRDYWKEHRVTPAARWTVRFMTETIGDDRNRLYELCPYGYGKRACKIAGMMVMIGIRVVRFLPVSLADADIDPNFKAAK